jgi:hypothetical protein
MGPLRYHQFAVVPPQRIDRNDRFAGGEILMVQAMRGLAQRSSMGRGHAADISAGLAQDAVLHHEKAQATILSAVEPGSTGEDQDSEVGGHGARQVLESTAVRNCPAYPSRLPLSRRRLPCADHR